MRILSQRIYKGVGFLRVLPVDEDDFWHLYNLITIGDLVKTSTYRKIVKEGQTGSKTSERRRITLLLKVCEVNYWAEQHLLLNIKGRNVRESAWLSLGQFHTFQFEFNQPIVIYKENWDHFHFRIIDEIRSALVQSDAAALIMEEGVAHLCLIGQSTTTLKQKIEKHVVKKRNTNNDQRDKSMTEFFNVCLQSLEQDQLIENVKCLLVASPGFLKDDFLEYFKQQVQTEKYKHLNKCVEKLLLVPSSNGYLNSLTEILQDQKVQQVLEHTKALKEIKYLEKFFNMLRIDIEKVAYGKKDVMFAHQQGAIQTLLLTDKIARARDPKIRKEWLRLIEDVKSKGGEVYVFSSLHPSGKQLNNFTGIAAILYFGVKFEYEDDDDQEEEIIVQHQPEDMETLMNINDKVMVDFDAFDEEAFM